MLNPLSSPMAIFAPPLPASDLQSKLIAPDVVITYFRGHITNELALKQLPRFREVLQGSKAASWIMELTAMTGFDPGAITGGAAWWQAFKAVTGQQILVVSTQSAARMAAASLSFSIRLPVKPFAQLEPALAYAGVRVPRKKNRTRTGK